MKLYAIGGLVGLLLLSVIYGLWQSRARMKEERDAARAAHAAQVQVAEAGKKHQHELERIRGKYDELQNKMDRAADDGCLDRRIPDDLRLLVNKNRQAGDSGP